MALTNEPAEVDYLSHTEKGEQYSSRCTYRKTDLVVVATLPSKWLSRVYKSGFAVIDGLITLDISTPLVGEFGDGVSVRAATWLVRSLGTAYHVKRGFIANCGNINFHGKTLASAVRGLAKKLVFQALINMPRSEILEKSRLLAKSHPDLKVTLADSKAVGNCFYGTKDFLYRNGFDVDLSDPTAYIYLFDLLGAIKKEPRQEAFAVLCHILRKQRKITLAA